MTSTTKPRISSMQRTDAVPSAIEFTQQSVATTETATAHYHRRISHDSRAVLQGGIRRFVGGAMMGLGVLVGGIEIISGDLGGLVVLGGGLLIGGMIYASGKAAKTNYDNQIYKSGQAAAQYPANMQINGTPYRKVVNRGPLSTDLNYNGTLYEVVSPTPSPAPMPVYAGVPPPPPPPPMAPEAAQTIFPVPPPPMHNGPNAPILPPPPEPVAAPSSASVMVAQPTA